MSDKNNTPQLIDPEDSPTEPMDTLEGKIVLEMWKMPAIYAPKAANDNCSICHNLLTEKCATCLENSSNIIETTCNVVMGGCGHALHNHCMDKYSKDVKICPVDQSPWKPVTNDCSKSVWTTLAFNKPTSSTTTVTGSTGKSTATSVTATAVPSTSK